MKRSPGLSRFELVHELLDAICDTIACGDLASHLHAFRRVATGQVTPFHAAGFPIAQHDSGEGGAAQPGTGSPRARSSSSADRETGRHALVLAVTPLSIVPMRTLLAYGRSMRQVDAEPAICAACGEEVPPETVICPLCGRSALPL